MNIDISESSARTCSRPVRSVPRPRVSRREQAEATRTLLLRTAERLYAEHGLSEVSSRHIAEAAGSANNSAVGYHIGTRNDLIDAITRSHSEPIGSQMQRMVVEARGSRDPRDHVACVVRPYTDHLGRLGTPSWCARFTAQITTDPTYGEHHFFDAIMTPLLREAQTAAAVRTPQVTDEVAELRGQMMRVMVVHTCAEQERVSARTGVATDWTLVGDTLIDALTSVLLGSGGDARPLREKRMVPGRPVRL